jgi:hypothetical protein
MLRFLLGEPYLNSGMPHETKKRIGLILKRWRPSSILSVAVTHE